MAIGLADLAVRFGLPVSILPTNTHEQPVHRRWDHNVLGRSTDFRMWAKECSHVVWFDVQRNKLLDTKEKDTKNILVPLWHRLRLSDLEVLPLYDHVVCPHARCEEALSELVDANYVTAAWDPGTPLVDNPQRYGGTRLLTVFDPFTTENLGHFMLHTLHTLLDAVPSLRLTLWHDKRWTTAAHKAYGDLMGAHGQPGCSRICALRKPTDMQRAQAYATHDWVFYPAVKDNAALPLLEGLFAARPGIAFGSLPQVEVIKQGYNGMIVPCEHQVSPLGAHEVLVNRHLLADELHKILADESLYNKLTETNWTELLTRRYQFQRTWKEIWGCL